MQNDTDNFSTGPAGVFAHIEHEGQHLTVVKLQEAYVHNPEALQQQLTQELGLASNALLLVLPSEGKPLLGQGPAEELYNNFLSKNTAAVVEQPWQPLGN
ncbi:hypothetical protein HMJ29_02320 [Hymenobacter taeanensis]|uniref:Uncharacterized protein n=1 Tax=Hymenobacter taeanensis TaxID=2735321 RepID=A0A6M6BCZ8_9BACT|nr:MULTISPECIES: hypothetical protein [Hymenobacter]QJX45832.1 hypothetical protein HMJ29_02320 [Hymenobacter taeanensis]UOQ79675.1 hypothetical protein MUN83_12525 [Hymenobacter sp. 5414T-23]